MVLGGQVTLSVHMHSPLSVTYTLPPVVGAAGSAFGAGGLTVAIGGFGGGGLLMAFTSLSTAVALPLDVGASPLTVGESPEAPCVFGLAGAVRTVHAAAAVTTKGRARLRARFFPRMVL